MINTNIQPVYNPKNTNETVIIGGKSYTQEYANDPKNQEEIRQAVVGGGNNIYTSGANGLTNNANGNIINSNSNGAMASTGSSYSQNGNMVTPYSQGNQIGTVGSGSIFDPNSSNFNSLIANSNGKINLQNQGDYNSQGIFTGASSGSKSEADSLAYYNKIMGGNSGNGGSNGYQSYSGGSDSMSNNLSGVSSSYNGSISGDANLNALKEFQKQAAIAGLDKAKNASLSNLSADKAAIQPKYYNNRAETSTASQLGAKNLAEYMASRGQYSAGASMQGELNRTNQLSGDINNWKTQEQSALNSNAKQATDTNNAYNSDLAASNAGIEAEGMKQLIAMQEQRRAEQIAQANADRAFNYQTSRDTIGDNRYNTETTYNQGRDSMSDIKWATEGNYQAEQNKINQTGQMADGSYTQSGQMNNLNIQQQQAQLAEMQNPNSTTNQLAKLGLQTAQLNFAALPQQLKSQAQQIAQQLASGAIDMKTAQIKLDYLPTQIKADLAATNRSNQPSGGGENGGYTKAELGNQAWATFVQQVANGNGEEWLAQNATDIINIDNKLYTDMFANINKLPTSQATKTSQYSNARKQNTLDYNRQPM
jgi:hypothetical protein